MPVIASDLRFISAISGTKENRAEIVPKVVSEQQIVMIQLVLSDLTPQESR